MWDIYRIQVIRNGRGDVIVMPNIPDLAIRRTIKHECFSISGAKGRPVQNNMLAGFDQSRIGDGDVVIIE
jgi:hypothetical protein